MPWHVQRWFASDGHNPLLKAHLKKLKGAGLIDSRPDKTWTEYFINRRGDEYSRIIMGNLSGWLNDDPIIVEDLKKAAKANRDDLCGKQ